MMERQGGRKTSQEHFLVPNPQKAPCDSNLKKNNLSKNLIHLDTHFFTSCLFPMPCPHSPSPAKNALPHCRKATGYSRSHPQTPISCHVEPLIKSSSNHVVFFLRCCRKNKVFYSKQPVFFGTKNKVLMVLGAPG